MATCTFFGHRECPETIKPKLRETLIDLITNHDVDMFYVGNQGQFDVIVRSVLRELKVEYPQITYAVVLAYMPGKKTEYDDHSDTMLPEGIESVFPRYAIHWRNNWMIQHSDYLVVYITHPWGGAAQYTKKPRKQEKTYLIREIMKNGNHFLRDILAFLEIMFYNMFVSFKTSVCIK